MAFRGLSTVATLTLVSRVLGLIRDAGMAVLFGAGPLLDAFSLAFRIPNLARRLFGEGALSTAFLPVFLKTYAENPICGRRVAWSCVGLLGAGLSLLVIVAELAIASSLPFVGSELAVLLELIAWLFPYVVFICVAAQFAAVLHGIEHFFWPAILPVVLNGIWLLAIATAPELFDAPITQIRFIAASVVVAGAIQCGLVARAVCVRGLGISFEEFKEDRDATKQAMRRVLATMLPTLIGLTVTQLNVVVDSALAWTLSASSGISGQWQWVESGTATALYLGQRLFQFPLGVFGVALGTVLFPVLTRHAHAKRKDLLSRDLTYGLKLTFSIGLPASLGLILLSEPIPRLLFEYGAFDAADTLATSKMIAGYGVGVWAAVALLIVNRAFFAVGDTRTPLRAGLFAVALNLFLDGALVYSCGGFGLALATSFSAVCQLLYSLQMLKRTVAPIEWRDLFTTVAKASAATIAMTVGIEITMQSLSQESGRLLELAVPLTVGILTYFACAKLVGLQEVFGLLKREAPGGSE